MHQQPPTRSAPFAWLLALASVAGCSDTMAADATASFAPSPGASGEASAGAPSAPAPEREVESDYEAPVATGRFVWVANPKSGRVAYVDASTLEVRTVFAGNGPTFLAGVPGGGDTTLVLNVLSEDATLLKAEGKALTQKTFRTAKQANSIAFSSDGRFAIAWADARKVKGATPRTEGFQDIAVLDLALGTSTILAVGYRPVAVSFASGSPHAYAVTQDGVAVIDLSAVPAITANIATSDSPNEDPGSRDVSITPDGSTAIIRRDDDPTLTSVALDTGVRKTLTLPGPITDFDLTESGDRGVAVIRATSEAFVLRIPEAFGPTPNLKSVSVTGETVGSVAIAPGGTRAVLYSNAVAAERVSILELTPDPPTYRTTRLYAPVLAVFNAPDAAHAVVLHAPTGDTSANQGAFSVVPLTNALPAKIVATQATPTAVAVASDRALVAERDDQTHVFGAYLVRTPQLMVDRFPLASPPIAVGIVSQARRAFVAQQHPDGRLTFIDLDTGVARTLTGFELSSRVVDGSKP